MLTCGLHGTLKASASAAMRWHSVMPPRGRHRIDDVGAASREQVAELEAVVQHLAGADRRFEALGEDGYAG